MMEARVKRERHRTEDLRNTQGTGTGTSTALSEHVRPEIRRWRLEYLECSPREVCLDPPINLNSIIFRHGLR